MVVVSDTSPLNYLILIDTVDILPRMYGRVIVPIAVAHELSADGAPAEVKSWLASKPLWLETHPTSLKFEYPELDRGEVEAISLAKSLHADLLLVDERLATRIAREKERLATTGTLGVLLDASRLGLVDFPTVLQRLQNQTTFRASPLLYQQLLEAWKTQNPPKPR
jgi:predicted nucleic acid-binding protein